LDQAGKKLSEISWAEKRTPLSFSGAVALAAMAMGLAILTGCGNTYRPVVSSISPVGPAGQPTKYAAAISSPSPNSPGLLTVVDVSGDTVLSTPQVLSNPSYFAITQNGVEGFVINPSGAFNDFGLSNPTALLTSNIVQTTLPANSTPVSISTISLASSASTIFVPSQGNAATAPAVPPNIAALNTSGPALEQQITVGATPVYVAGADGAIRVYAISQGASAAQPNCPNGGGQVAALEAVTFSVSNTICVGPLPIYGVMTTDTRRAFILNQGTNAIPGSVSVINVIDNGLDTVPSIALPPITYAKTVGGVTTTVTANPKPVWADLTSVTNELVVLNQGDGVGPGSLSIVNIPLCSPSTQSVNPTCDANNPVDAAGFGTVLATVPVGIHPTMVAMLHDGTQAYIVNQGDFTGQCAAGEGSVTVVNLVTTQVQTTICGISTPAGISSVNASPTLIYGHPNTIAVTTGTPTGKVYVTSPDAQFMTIIYTDTNSVVTHIPLQGYGLRVLVTTP
jgi:hypothetical protein